MSTSYSLYAIWTKTAQTYNVIYYINDGTSTTSHTDSGLKIADNEAAKSNTDFGWTNGTKTFDGWYVNASNSSTMINAGTKFSTLGSSIYGADKTIKLYAKWNSTEYTVNFKDEDGTTALPSSIMSTTTADYSVSTTSVAVPSGTKQGYTFGGWKLTNASGAQVANASGTLESTFSPVADKTYTFAAIWNEITYTINWYEEWNNTNQPVSGHTATTTIRYKTDAAVKLDTQAATLSVVPANKRETSGSGSATATYEFQGWYVTKSGSTWDSSSAGTPITNLTLSGALAVSGRNATSNSLTVYAVWKKIGGAVVMYSDNKGTYGAGTSANLHTDNKLAGDTYTIWNPSTKPTLTGYTFEKWTTNADGTGDSYTGGESITLTNPGNYNFYAQWTPNTVHFKLEKGAEDSSINLNGLSDPNALVGADVTESTLTGTVQPTRDNYDFKGWSLTKDGTVVVFDATSTKYTVTRANGASAAPARNEVTLYATWEPTKYTVKYYGNQVSTDSRNNVSFTKDGNPVSNPYTYTTTAVATDAGFDNPGLDYTYGDGTYSNYSWYRLVGWSTTSAGTTPITNGQTFKNLYGDQTDKVLELYAIWEAKTIDVYYTAADSNGTVSPVQQLKINLATGQDSDVLKSHASATATGYDLATPTWTDTSGNSVDGCSTTASQADYAPSIDYLRKLKTENHDSFTFRANFAKGTYNYEVWAYLEDADGNFPTSPKKYAMDSSSQYFTGAYGDPVTYTDVVAGTALKDIVLKESTGTVLNSNLYDVDTSSAHSSNLSVNLAAERSGSISSNVIKIYYIRKTYKLTGAFQTEDKNGNKTAGAPTGFAGSVASYINNGNPTTNLRWGQSITMTDPAPKKDGYVFSWSVTSPSGATSAAPATTAGSTFALNETDFANLGSNDATLTGTFKVKTYTIVLNDEPDPGEPASMHNWTSGDSASTLNSAHVASKTGVAADEYLGTFVPDFTDTPDLPNYFSGWYLDGDSEKTPISGATLLTKANWDQLDTDGDGVVTFKSIWKEKVVITYDAGDNDSYGTPKAAWAGNSVKLGNIDTTSILANVAAATFESVVTGGVDSGTGDPKANAGWVFAYWTIQGGTGEGYGHSALYTGTTPAAATRYLKGTTETDGIKLSKSYTFVAHWKAKNQTVVIRDYGKVTNNTSNTDTVTATLPTVTKTYVTDSVLDLSDYTPTSVPAGYTFTGWKDVNGTTTYGKTDTFHIKNGGVELEPTFTEDTAEIKYVVASASSSRGVTIAPAGSETVYVVKHNTTSGGTVATRTASTNDTHAYKFSKWTYSTATAASDASGQITADDVFAAIGTLAGDSTYTFEANFDVNQYTVTIDPNGTDGTNTFTGIATAAGTGSNGQNGYKVDWNTTIPSGASITINVPTGYELDGWIVDGTGTPQTWGTPTAANLQGVMSYQVTDDHKLTPHFKVSDQKNFIVNYVFDPEGISHFAGSSTSNNVAWNGDVLPPASADSNPQKAGYTFKYWYVDKDNTNKKINDIDSTGHEFGKIYTYLKDLKDGGATVSGVDTTSGSESITIYAKWEAKPFTVAYDTYGRDDTGTALPDVSGTDDDPNPSSFSTVTVSWGDQASTFKKSAAALTRPGYDLVGWYATYDDAGVAHESSANVGDTDTFATLAENNESHNVVTLHAIWKAKTYKVEYIYNDAAVNGTETPSVTGTYGWTELRDFFNDPAGNHPSATDWTFDGWDVTYSGNNGSGAVTGNLTGTPSRVKSTTGATTIKALRNGDTLGLGSAVVVTLKGHWTQQTSFVYQDVLVHVDGTDDTTTGDETTPTTVDGNTDIYFTDATYGYGSPKTKYEGYDFDGGIASNPNHTKATNTDHMTATAGSPLVYKVYYLERSYTIEYYVDNNAGSTPVASTTDNPWESAVIKVPSTDPTLDGYVFGGWKINGTLAYDPTDSTATKKLSELFTNAPDLNTVIKAVAEWTPMKVTITWKADTGGTLDIGDGSKTNLDATDTTWPAPTPKATPADNYQFDGWYASYTDGRGSHLERVDAYTSPTPYATLSGTDKDVLTMKQWNQTSSTGNLMWYKIDFIAKFAPSSSIKVTIHHYKQDTNAAPGATNPWIPLPDTYDYKQENDSYTATALSSTDLPGFHYESSRSTETITVHASSSNECTLYYMADPNKLHYEYVESTDGTTAQTAGEMPTDAPALSTFGDGSTYYTDQQITVANAPSSSSASSAWTFDGWYQRDPVTNAVDRTTKMDGKTLTFAGSDIYLVGTWTRVYKHVEFINCDSTDQAAIDGCTVTEPTGGFDVYYGGTVANQADRVRPALSADATQLSELPVTVNINGAHELIGWNVYEDDNLVMDGDKAKVIGTLGPLSYPIKSKVTFRAVYADTYTVTYEHGLHSDFATVTWAKLSSSTEIDPGFVASGATVPTGHVAYNGTTETRSGHENYGNPNGNDGWAWAGWGYADKSGTWHYCFAYDSAVDYGTTVSPYTAADSMPAKVDTNYHFVAFWKAMPRKLVYSLKQYDGHGVGSYTESTTEFANSTTGKKPEWVGTPVTVVDPLLTGQGTTLLAASVVKYDGYELIGWTYDGVNRMDEGSATAFKMPEFAYNTTPGSDTVLYLYPMFQVKKLTITYVVDADSKSPDRGSLEGPAGTTGNGYSDARNLPTDKINGSTPKDNPGYEFDYWTKDSDTTHLTPTEGLQTDGRTLVPSESGEYHAHFKQKKYNFEYAKSTTDTTETLPTASLPVDAVWTDSFDTGTPTFNGYDFDGWDVYEKTDWDTNSTSGTKLHSGLKDTQLVSALSDSQGNATKLVLVPSWTKTQLGLTYHAGSAAGVTWSTNASDFPAKTSGTIADPMNTGAYANGDQERKINVVIGDVIDLRQASSITRRGYKLVGWMDTATAGATTNYYYFDADLDGDGISDAGITLTSPYVLTMGATSVDLYPIWAAKGGAQGYHVTFDANAGTDTVTGLPTNWDGKFDDTGINVAAPSRAGYTFTGWTADPTTAVAPTVADGATATADYAVMANGNDTITTIKLTANWQAKTDYKVTYVANAPAGTTYSGATVAVPDDRTNVAFNASDIKQTALAEADLPGYTFEGWVVTRDDTGATIATVDATTGYADATFSTLVGGDATVKGITYTAQWKVKSGYKVTFDKGTTDTVTGLPTDWSGNWDGKSINVSAPSRAGYTFTGWTADPTTAVAPTVADGATATADYATMAGGVDTIKTIKLTANWQAKDYTVTYHLTTGEGSWSTNTANYPASEPALAGSYGPADPTGAIAYAKDATVTMRVDPTVDRTGYTLVGWQDDATAPTNKYYVDSAYATANGLAYTPSFTMPAANVDLYPIWSMTVYTVTFEPATASHPGYASVTGMPATNPWTGGYDDTVNYAAPTLTGYTFGGWDVYVTADYNAHTSDPTQATLLIHVGAGSDTYSALANDPNKDKLTMVAVWTAKGYGLTYVLTRGEGNWLPANITDSGAATPQALISYNTGDKFNLRNASTVSRPGWTLVGWKDSNSGTVTANEYRFGTDGEYQYTMPADNVYLYPIWEENDDYAVKFDGNAPTTNLAPGAALTNLPADQPVSPAKLTWEGATGFVDTHAPSFTGYKFLGWTVKGTDNVVINGTDTTPLKGAGYYFNVLAGGIDSAAHKTLTLVANWTIDDSYAVTFVDGVAAGEIPVTAGTMPADQTGLTYTSSVDHTKPTRRGYDFVDWTVEDITDPLNINTLANVGDGTSAYNAIAGNPAYKALRLTANWTPKTGYKVTFEKGTTDTTVTGLPAEWNGPYTGTDVDVSAPARKGYTFAGWTTDTDGATAPTVAAGTTAQAAYDTLATQDDTIKTVNLIANWTPITYKVTFAPGTTDTVTGLPTDWSGKFDATGIDVSAPSRTGYTFAGWTTTTTGATAPTVAAGATATADYATMAGNDDTITTIDLVANWTVKKGYNVHFVDKPATDTGATAVNMGSLADILNMDWDAWFNAGPKPTRAGYTWLKWDVTNTTDPANVLHIGTATEGSYQYSKTAINKTTGKPDDTITDLTFTALWEPEEYKVTYILTSGEGSWVKANITDPGKNVPASAVKYDVDDTVAVRQGDTVVRAGYTLVGWQDAVTAPTNVYLVDAAYAAAYGAAVTTSFTMPANDVLLYPVWDAKSYAVYFQVNKPAGATDVLQVVSGMPADQTGLAWTDAVDTSHPTLAGYTFTGWTIKDAATTGAKRGTLTGTTYNYNDMALTDTADHASLTLVAQWEAAPYRVIYVDPTDATGAAVTPATQIFNYATAQWTDTLGIGDPASMFSYAGKSATDWQFDGWDVYDPNTTTYTRVLSTDDTSYGALAARENLTVADVATATDTPALVLYAAWTRRVPFIVDYVMSDTSVVEGSDTLTGLDGDDIATKWATTVLDMGDAHHIAGYTYNRLSSASGITGTLTAGADTLHLVLLYDPLTDYVVTYDATPGTNYAGATTDTAPAPKWNSADSGFAPNDADWAYKGHKIDHWTYGPTGTEYVFDATDGKTFAQIAAAIYGAAADGTQGRDLDGDGTVDNPVTLHAVWVERDDYKVKYDDNYNPTYDNGVEDKFLARTDDATFTPADRVNVTWSSDEIGPKDDTSQIVEPGVKGGAALYEIEGWNYSTDGGLTQHAADGMTFEQIADVLEAAGVWSDGDDITLYARWKEIQIQLTYTPVVVTVDNTGAFNTVVATGVGGTVTRASETVSAVTGGTASGTSLVALGSTPTASAGYHFIGWRRISDGQIIYAPAAVSTLSATSLSAMSTATNGFNVLPDGTIDTTTLFAASQNTSDGYWHSEDYQAMFVENDPAILHYDKNAEDATGTIADVTKPYGTLLTLDSGTEDATADTTDGFHRTGYTLRGWNTKADLTGTHYDLSTTDWPLPEGETTLYAEWEINNGRLIYDKNAEDATGTIADVVKPYGTAITLDSGTEDTTTDTTDGFHRPHYVLVGWNTKADYTGTHYDLSEGWTMPDGTTTLYAEWQKAKYEVSGPEGTKVTIPDGGGTTTEGGTTGGTTGTKIDGGYVTGGDPTEIEYGEPIPSGWITAIPESGKHVDHWTYTWIDEDGTVHTETADDPTKFTVKGDGTITPVFVDDPVETPETPATTSSETPSATPASVTPTTAAAHTAGETIPQTSDTFDAVLPLTTAGLGLLLILLAFATRRRDENEEA